MDRLMVAYVIIALIVVGLIATGRWMWYNSRHQRYRRMMEEGERSPAPRRTRRSA